MNKKLNTLLFFVGATAVNILIVLVLVVALFVPYAMFLANRVPGVVNLVALIGILFGSMAGSFPIYRRLVTWFGTKVEMEKYFDPIVKPKRRRP